MWTQRCPKCPGTAHLAHHREEVLLAVSQGGEELQVPMARRDRLPDTGVRDQAVLRVSAGRPCEGQCAGTLGLEMPGMQGLHSGAGFPNGPGRFPASGRLRPGEDACGPGHERSSHDGTNGFVFLGWLGSSVVQEQTGLNIEDVRKTFDVNNTFVCWHHGDKVPPSAGLRLKTPLGTRIIATCSGRGQWNFFSIERGSQSEYELGTYMTVLVLQEVKKDFVDYVMDQDLDPIEVTMSKNEKKELLTALSWPVIATPARANGSNLEIIADTGSEEDLISHSDLDVHFKERAKQIPSNAVSLITANGPVEADTKHEVHVEALDQPLQFVLLPNTPAVCSVGKKCMEQGFSFFWPKGEAPHFICPDGRKVQCQLRGNVPVFGDRGPLSACPATTSESSDRSRIAPTSVKNESGFR